MQFVFSCDGTGYYGTASATEISNSIGNFPMYLIEMLSMLIVVISRVSTGNGINRRGRNNIRQIIMRLKSAETLLCGIIALTICQYAHSYYNNNGVYVYGNPIYTYYIPGERANIFNNISTVNLILNLNNNINFAFPHTFLISCIYCTNDISFLFSIKQE